MAVRPIPEGYHSITPYFIVNGAAEAIEFYRKAFHATEMMRLPGPGGKVMHAEMRIGDSIVMMADECPEMQALAPDSPGKSGVGICLYVENVGETVRLSGWVHRIRDHGGVLFIDLRDHYGITQVLAELEFNGIRVDAGRLAELTGVVGAGDLLIESGAESGQQHFTDIRQPDRVQRVIHAELEERRRPSAGVTIDVAEQLERLGYDTHTLDLPIEDPKADLDDYAEVVVEAMESLDRPWLLGHSMGGLVVPRANASEAVK